MFYAIVYKLQILYRVSPQNTRLIGYNVTKVLLIHPDQLELQRNFLSVSTCIWTENFIRLSLGSPFQISCSRLSRNRCSSSHASPIPPCCEKRAVGETIVHVGIARSIAGSWHCWKQTGNSAAFKLM